MATKRKPRHQTKKTNAQPTQLDMADYLSINPKERNRLKGLIKKIDIESLADPPMMASEEMTGRAMMVSPALAAHFLRHGAANRDSDPRRVAQYAKKMGNGQWEEDPPHPQGLIFDTKGRLIDGKTRLLAVLKHNKAVRFWVIQGASPDSIASLDSGRGRSIAQTGTILGLGTTSMAVSVTKGLFINPEPPNNRIPRITDRDIVFKAYRRYKEGIDFACRRYGGARGGVGVASVRSVIARAYYDQRNSEDYEELARFIEVLDTGYSSSALEVNAVMIRNAYFALPARQGDRGGLELHRKTIYALDSYLDGKAITKLMQSKKQKFPLDGVGNED